MKPTPGDRFRNTTLAPDHQRHVGTFVRSVRRRVGGSGSGIFYELTNADGDTWEASLSVLKHRARVPISPAT